MSAVSLLLYCWVEPPDDQKTQVQRPETRARSSVLLPAAWIATFQGNQAPSIFG